MSHSSRIPRVAWLAGSLVAALVIGTIGVGSVGAEARPQADKASFEDAVERSRAIRELGDNLDAIAKHVSLLVAELEDAKVTISTVEKGMRAGISGVQERRAHLLDAIPFDAEVATEIAPILEQFASETGSDTAFRDIGTASNLQRSLTTEIRYQQNQLRAMEQDLRGIETVIRQIEFRLGKEDKTLGTMLSLSRQAVRGARIDPEAVEIVDAIRNAQEGVRFRQRELSILESELQLTVAQIARQQRSVEEIAERQLPPPWGTDGAISGTVVGGGCLKSIYSGTRLSDQEIAQHAFAAGFQDFDLVIAVAISLAESGGDPGAVCVDYNGTRDEGLWQINSIHQQPQSCTFDPKCNAEVAYAIYQGRDRTFSAWSSYNSGTFLGYLSRGIAAAEWVGGNPFAVFEVCPVDQPHQFSDDFGAPRVGHTHQGNDIFAPMGTPIRAPFDGTAVAAPNSLGGEAVVVYGGKGYVYNAHLSAYGELGAVQAGTIIGFVGTSGNAVGTPPHDHFEWHPGDGAAVNPYLYLTAVC